MAGLMAGVAIMLIMSSVAFQAWSDVLRRDNEAEMIFRAQDIVRAIQRYRRDHGGAGPDSLERLMEPGPKGQYYLRRLYEDPLVPDGKWGLLYIGPGGGIIDPNAVTQTGFGEGGLGMQGSQMGKGKGKGFGLQSGMNQAGQQGQLGQGGQPGKGGMGGMLIAGVRTLSEEEPFRVYNGLTEYSEWMFSYLDLEQQGQQRRGRQRGRGIEGPGSANTGAAGNYPGFGSGPPSSKGQGQ
jgi:type II secretory pathway pseudopilin PulG